MKIVDEDGLVVEEIATHHGDCPSVAYRISYHSVVVVFSGDMDASALPAQTPDRTGGFQVAVVLRE
jgi:hypothetical protein